MRARRSEILSLRSAFRTTADGAHRQLGLRYLKDALALVGKNDEVVAEKIALARFHLPYAEAR